jgi:hypothetical protein
MVLGPAGHHHLVMNTALEKVALVVVGLPFSAVTAHAILKHGYFGFLTLSFREPWALQMLLDLCIALFFVGGWLRRDAREHGISAIPYLVLMPFVGSAATLAYLVHRALRGRTTRDEAVTGIQTRS